MTKRALDRFPGMALLIVAAAIFWFRLTRSSPEPSEPQPAPHIQIMGMSEQGTFIDEPFFRQNIWEPQKQLFNESLVNMLVFVSPDQDCPSVLYETEVWSNLALAAGASIFGLHLYMPQTTPLDVIDAYAETFALQAHQIHFFMPEDKTALYAQQGLFKVIWSLEDGFLWCEHGSPSPYDQDRTRQKLEDLVLPLME